MAGTFWPSPIILHVLAVDGDPLCLALLETMLLHCNYAVRTCGTVRQALALLREDHSKFNIVMSEVHLPNEDGFQLLELVGLEMDLPVIMMSNNEETSTVLKGIIHGACDYLVKPLRMEELKNIWQHVVRRMGKDLQLRDGNGDRDGNKSLGFLKEGGGKREGEGERGRRRARARARALASASNNTSKKRKEQAEISSDEIVDDISSLRKARVFWSVQLHRQFLDAVNELGIKNATPKGVLEIMNVQGLTRENVASHLQKYRIYLKRLSGLELTPCLIASFLAWKDGTPGGVMNLVPCRKPLSTTSGIKGLNLGAGLGVGLGARESLDLETEKSLLQFKMQKQQRPANQAQVLGALGLADRKPHCHQSISSNRGQRLQRMCSLDLQYLSEETLPLDEVTTPSPPSSTTADSSMKKKNNRKKNGGGGGNGDDAVGESREGPRSHANRWIERMYSGSQIVDPIQEMACALEPPPPAPPPKLIDSCSSSNHFPDLMRALTADNPQDKALSGFALLPVLPDVSDYFIDENELFENEFMLHLLPEYDYTLKPPLFIAYT